MSRAAASMRAVMVSMFSWEDKGGKEFKEFEEFEEFKDWGDERDMGDTGDDQSAGLKGFIELRVKS